MENFSKALILGAMAWLIFLPPPAPAAVLINEVLTATEAETKQGNPLEWIELRNTDGSSINLQGYTLTDDASQTRKWVFPSVSIPANGYLRVYASGENRGDPNGLHVNFRLNRSGEAVVLFDENGILEDFVQYPEQRREVSYGRLPENLEEWRFFETPSPGKANPTRGALGIAAKPSFSKSGRLVLSPFTLTLSGNHPSSLIRYTTDGSEPSRESREYTGPIEITQTQPVRARVFRDDFLPSDTVTNTYLFDNDLPTSVMMISTADENLFDRRSGIYAHATQHGRAWERAIHVEFFTQPGFRLFGVDAGLRMHGGASRERADKKSFRLYFRDEYGPARLNAKLFSETPVREFDKLVLRAGYNDSWIHWDEDERRVAVYLSDELARRVHRDMGSIAASGIFTELYLNGEYWGLYNITERLDEDFMASYDDYEEEQWDIVSDDEVTDGDPRAWRQFKSFVTRANFADPNDYEELKTWVELEQITSYYILNIYVQNHDWPHHNWAASRPRVPEGKWRFFAWDTEDSFGSGASRGRIDRNTFQRAQDTSTGILALLFDKMLESPHYQEFFINELERHFNGALSQENLLNRLEPLVEAVRPALSRESVRWNPNRDLDDFDAAVDIARSFIRQREAIVRRHVENGLRRLMATPTPTFTPTPTPIGFDPTPTPPPQPPIGDSGIFEASRDIGKVEAPGSSEYNPQANAYRVRASGEDIWNQADEFHFLYRLLSGDFTLQAKMEGTNFGTSPWVKLTLMARETLRPEAKHFAARFQQSTMEASSQWRDNPGQNAGSSDGALRIPQSLHDGRLRLVRKGDEFSTYYFDVSKQEWTLIDDRQLPMDNPIYVGLAVTSHDDGNFAEGLFTAVLLQLPATPVRQWQWHEFYPFQ